jgi:hypothetical protein
MAVFTGNPTEDTRTPSRVTFTVSLVVGFGNPKGVAEGVEDSEGRRGSGVEAGLPSKELPNRGPWECAGTETMERAPEGMVNMPTVARAMPEALSALRFTRFSWRRERGVDSIPR